LGALAVALPRLATLNFQGCSRLGDAGVARLAALPQLRHVLLPAGVTDAAMQALAEMPGEAPGWPAHLCLGRWSPERCPSLAGLVAL
jgi:hypothetical protein